MSNALCSTCTTGNPLCVSCFPEFSDNESISEDPPPVFEFLIEDLIKPTKQPKGKIKSGHILGEKDILDFVKLDNKRARVRTTRGLFCCLITKSQKLKVVKVLRTKQSSKLLAAPSLEDEEVLYPQYFSETPILPVEDWGKALKEFLSEGRDDSTLEVIPRDVFIRQFLAALHGA